MLYPGMEFLVHFLTAQRRHIRREIVVECPHQPFTGNTAVGLERHSKVVGMNAGIRPGAALELHLLSQDLFQHRLEGPATETAFCCTWYPWYREPL